MMKKLFFSLILVAMVSIMAVSGYSKQAKTASPTLIKVAWWGSQNRAERTIKVLDLYKSKNPHVKFEMEYLSGPDYNTKLATQAATGQLPDLFQTDYGWISQYVQKGLIADLRKFARNGTIDFANVSKKIVTTGEDGGKLYGVPLGVNATSMFYDPAVFKNAGITQMDPEWTWEDYDKILTTVYKKTHIAALPLYYHIPEAMLEVIVRQKGYSLFSKNGTALGFKNPVIIQPMFQRILELTKAGVYAAPEIWSTSITTEDNGLVLGKASTAYGGSNQLVSYMATAKRELGITSIPFNGKNSGAYLKPSMMFSINNRSSESVKAESAKIINFFINSKEAARILMDERGVPISTGSRKIVEDLSNSNSKMVFNYINFIEEHQKAPNEWAPPKASQVYSILADLYMRVAFQKITPAAAATSFIKQANAILAHK
jgi:multiple sugar transport system substrate-binding protein